MRVIAGTARHLPLKTIPGNDTRPTTDRIKETLFNMIQAGIPGCVFVDLFSGSGAIGIEALSRGARQAYFVEKMSGAAECIRENLAFTRLAECGELLRMDVMNGISRLEKSVAGADYIFMDPPYGKEWEKQVLIRLQDSPLVDQDTVLILEANLDTDFSYIPNLGYEIIKKKVYKTNQHIFCRRKQDEVK